MLDFLRKVVYHKTNTFDTYSPIIPYRAYPRVFIFQSTEHLQIRIFHRACTYKSTVTTIEISFAFRVFCQEIPQVLESFVTQIMPGR